MYLPLALLTFALVNEVPAVSIICVEKPISKMSREV
jgi:hypothetical protein